MTKSTRKSQVNLKIRPTIITKKSKSFKKKYSWDFKNQNFGKNLFRKGVYLNN